MGSQIVCMVGFGGRGLKTLVLIHTSSGHNYQKSVIFIHAFRLMRLCDLILTSNTLPGICFTVRFDAIFWISIILSSLLDNFQLWTNHTEIKSYLFHQTFKAEFVFPSLQYSSLWFQMQLVKNRFVCSVKAACQFGGNVRERVCRSVCLREGGHDGNKKIGLCYKPKSLCELNPTSLEKKKKEITRWQQHKALGNCWIGTTKQNIKTKRFSFFCTTYFWQHMTKQHRES